MHFVEKAEVSLSESERLIGELNEKASKLEGEGWNWAKPGQQPPEGAELFTSPRGARYWRSRQQGAEKKPSKIVEEKPKETPKFTEGIKGWQDSYRPVKEKEDLKFTDKNGQPLKLGAVVKFYAPGPTTGVLQSLDSYKTSVDNLYHLKAEIKLKDGKIIELAPLENYGGGLEQAMEQEPKKDIEEIRQGEGKLTSVDAMALKRQASELRYKKGDEKGAREIEAEIEQRGVEKPEMTSDFETRKKIWGKTKKGIEEFSKVAVDKKVERRGDKYVVVSCHHDPGKVLGTHDTKKEALAQHRAIQANKMEKQGPPGPPPRPGLIWHPETHRWVRSIETGVSDEGQKKSKIALKREFVQQARELKQKLGKKKLSFDQVYSLVTDSSSVNHLSTVDQHALASKVYEDIRGPLGQLDPDAAALGLR